MKLDLILWIDTNLYGANERLFYWTIYEQLIFKFQPLCYYFFSFKIVNEFSWNKHRNNWIEFSLGFLFAIRYATTRYQNKT